MMDKTKIQNALSDYLMNNALSIFRYDGLPDNVKAVDFEKKLLTIGRCLFTKWHNEFYIFDYSDTGKQNYLGEYTSYQVNNPYINCNDVFSDDNAVKCLNDDTGLPLIQMMNMFSELLSESYITLNLKDINSRVSFLISARDNSTKQSAEIFLKQLYDGKQGIIGDQPLFDSLNINPLSDKSSDITQLIELNKFLYSDYFQKIGLLNLYNNVHDRISATETEFTATSIYPYVDNMMRNRQQAVDKINKLFGLSVKVEFTSSWDYRIKNGQNLTPDDFKDNEQNSGGEPDEQNSGGEPDEQNSGGEPDVPRETDEDKQNENAE